MIGSATASDDATRGGRPLEIGDIWPKIKLPDQSGASIDLSGDDHAGRPTVLLFLSDLAQSEAVATLGRWEASLEAIGRQGGQLVAVTTGTVAHTEETISSLGLEFPVLTDSAAQAFADYGLIDVTGELSPDLACGFVVRGNGHVMGVLEDLSDRAVNRAMELLRAEAELRATRTMRHHPPILLVPDVLSREDCRRLITVFLMEGNQWVEPGHGDPGLTSDYKMRIPEYGRRDRVDHWIISAKTRDFVSARLQARLFPEIEKAFHYKITRAETYRIGCYEGERGGEPHGHRDNSSAMGAHRRFACSINLNSEDFDGGELRFPEFGDQRYRPETGTAFTFSSTLLHEPLPVTGGRRFVLLAFLFGET